MPNPENGCTGLVEIFHEHIFSKSGVPWTMTAAIMGAHTIGSAKPENSGYDGFWSDAASSGIFNNQYYQSLTAKGWTPELAVGGNPDKNQWARVDMGLDPEHKELMLTTDVCMAFGNSPTYVKCMVDERGMKGKANFCGEKGLRISTELDPHFQQCCTWVNANTLEKFGGYFDNGPRDYCGKEFSSISEV